MRRRTIALLCSALVLAWSCSKDKPLPTVPQTATLAGTVRHAGTGDPIPGATIAVGTNSTISGLDGKFELTGLEVRQVTVTASASGFITSSVTITLHGGTNDPCIVPLTPEPTASLSGQVQEKGTGMAIPFAVITVGGVIDSLGHNNVIQVAKVPLGDAVAMKVSAPWYKTLTLTMAIHAGDNPLTAELERDVPADFRTIVVDGRPRYYKLYDPLPKPHGRVPLVIVLHGGAKEHEPIEWTREMEEIAGFDQAAYEARFAVAYPVGPASHETTGWKAMAGDTTPAPEFTGIDDVKFISAMIDALIQTDSIDALRVYATGHSYGGSMAYKLAHEASSRIRAVAPVSALEPESNPSRAPQPVAILHMHALDDPNARFFNPGTRHGERLLPVLESLERWRTAQGCAATADTVYSKEDGSILGVRWRSVDGKGDVFLYTSTTGGHAVHWPAWQGFDAARVIWDVFKNVPAR